MKSCESRSRIDVEAKGSLKAPAIDGSKALRHLNPGQDQDQWKVVLLGGDQEQADSFIGEAVAKGLSLDYFDSVLSMGFLGRFRDYDAAIVHEDLAPLSALELAEYLEKLFQSLPMIVLQNESNTPDNIEADRDADEALVYCSTSENAAEILSKVISRLKSPQNRGLRAGA